MLKYYLMGFKISQLHTRGSGVLSCQYFARSGLNLNARKIKGKKKYCNRPILYHHEVG